MSTRMGRSLSAIRRIPPVCQRWVAHYASASQCNTRFQGLSTALPTATSLGWLAKRGRYLTFDGEVRIFGRTRRCAAEVAELVDAPDSGSGPGLPGGGS